MTRRKCFISLTLVLIVSFLVLSGCGGGTIGTAPTHSRNLSGFVRSADGLPIEDTELFIAETQSLTVTDAEGRFSFDSSLAGPQAELSVRPKGFDENSRVMLSIPVREDRPSRIAMELELSNGVTKISRFADLSLIPSPSCAESFYSDVDLFQTQPLTQECTISLSVMSDEGLTTSLTASVIPTSCPSGLSCQRAKDVELDNSNRGNFIIPSSSQGEICNYLLEIVDQRNQQVLQSISISGVESERSLCKR
jgi:hypothetical protein